MTLSPQWLDELRARVSLAGVIGRTLRLQKAGREFKACCPFHNEKTPSFTVVEDKGFYHCFGCGAHGDAIRWLTDQRGMAFMDAIKDLAAEAGMELPAPDPRAARAAEERRSIDDVMGAAQAWFVSNLAGGGGEAARRYLATRGVSTSLAERFGFGFAPDGRNGLGEALARFGDDALIEAGLRIRVDGKPPYDRFRGRLMLPIEDARGRVIGFGGRILDKEREGAPKYLNSPDTPLFDKGRTLYNLHRAAPAARRNGRLLVVEGYMDVVGLAAAGVEEAVAPLGTALTEHQIERLWRVVETPVLCFDGDAAGRRAATRAALRALPLLRPSHSLAIATLPAGLDPDDLARRDGAGAIEALVVGAESLVEVLWASERDAAPLATPEDKAGLKRRLLDHASTIADRDISALYRREWLERYDALAFPPRPPRARAPFVGKGRTPPPPSIDPGAAARLRERSARGNQDGLAAAVLAGLVRHPHEIARHINALARLELDSPALARLADALILLADEAAEIEPERLATILASRGVPALDPADYAGVRFGFLEGDSPEGIGEAMAVLVEAPAIDRARDAALARFAEDPDGADAELKRLRERKLALTERLRQRAYRPDPALASAPEPNE